MSLELWHLPQICHYHHPGNFKLIGIRIMLQADVGFHREQYPEFDLDFSPSGKLLGILLRQPVHPRRLWRALQAVPFGIECFILAKLDPMLLEHDRHDPLGRRFGPPPGNRFGSR